MDANGRIIGIRIAEHRETPGIGDAIEPQRSGWLLGFPAARRKTRRPRLAAAQGRREFDAITGATISSRAVVTAVGRAVQYFASNRDEIFAAPVSGRRIRARTTNRTGRRNDDERITCLWHRTRLAQHLPRRPVVEQPRPRAASRPVPAARGQQHGLHRLRTRRRHGLRAHRLQPAHLAHATPGRPRVRLPAYVLIIAAFVTAVDLLFEALWFDLYRGVGLFVALIVTNCVILGRAEAFASRHPPGRALADGLAHGLGFLAVLVALGAIRELIGFVSLFRGADLIFGPGVDPPVAVTAVRGLLLATLPPGAFFGLACLVAARKAWFDRRHAEPAAPDAAALPQTR